MFDDVRDLEEVPTPADTSSSGSGCDTNAPDDDGGIFYEDDGFGRDRLGWYNFCPSCGCKKRYPNRPSARKYVDGLCQECRKVGFTVSSVPTHDVLVPCKNCSTDIPLRIPKGQWIAMAYCRPCRLYTEKSFD